MTNIRQLAQPGSASALGAEGRVFESRIADQIRIRVCGLETTHFITGLRPHESGVRFRKYLPDELAAYAHEGTDTLTDAQVRRLEFSECEPEDVVLDLGTDELNDALRDLLTMALQTGRNL